MEVHLSISIAGLLSGSSPTNRKEIISESYQTGINPDEVMVNQIHPGERFEIQLQPEVAQVKMELGLLQEDNEEAETFPIDSNSSHLTDADHGDSIPHDMDELGQDSITGIQIAGELHSTASTARDVAGPGQGMKRKRIRSTILVHFSYSEKELKYKCKYCTTTIAKAKNSSTGNMKKHLVRFHKSKMIPLDQQLIQENYYYHSIYGR